jgi:hypothetical protein
MRAMAKERPQRSGRAYLTATKEDPIRIIAEDGDEAESGYSYQYSTHHENIDIQQVAKEVWRNDFK